MKLQELQFQYEAHNIAPPHTIEGCAICYRYEHRFDNPQADINGNGF